MLIIPNYQTIITFVYWSFEQLNKGVTNLMDISTIN